MHEGLVVTRLVAMALAASVALSGCVVTMLDAGPSQAESASTPAPTATPFPTPAEVAPEHTFTEVGNVGTLTGTHGVSGKAVVAGLQTLIIQGFSFDGKGSPADLRLVRDGAYTEPAVILATLEPRAYDGEMLLYIIPSSVTSENADRLVVYAPETSEVYAETTFQ